MKLSTEYIVKHLDEYLTEENGDWNQIHGGWTLGRKYEIKKYVYAIMSYFDNNGKISCNKVIKGFITEWYPSENKENLIFTSLDIICPHNTYHGKSVRFSNLADSCYSAYVENFAMFDCSKEAKEALKKCIKDNEKSTLEKQLNVINKEINKLQYDLNRKIDIKENIIKKLEKLN